MILAYVSEKAPINFAMKNTTWLTYGDKKTKTEKSETETYTYGIPVYKYTGIDTALEGAKFILSTNEQPSESNAIKFNPNGTIYRYSTDQTKGNITLTSGNNGHVDINGLKEVFTTLKKQKHQKVTTKSRSLLRLKSYLVVKLR